LDLDAPPTILGIDLLNSGATGGNCDHQSSLALNFGNEFFVCHASCNGSANDLHHQRRQ
jgi:hypothetical protein